MDQSKVAWQKHIADHLIEQLTKRHLEGSYALTAEQASKEVLAMIPDHSVVLRCGSMSAVQMGLWDALAERPSLTLIDPFQEGFSPEQRHQEKLKGLTADFMIASSNAITMDGRLVNLDAFGNRVAAMMFGPKKVILVVGFNKVVPDLDSALERVKNYAAPINATRLDYQTPCAKTGLCSDCRGPERICCMWSIIEGHMFKGRIHVKLIGEELGY